MSSNENENTNSTNGGPLEANETSNEQETEVRDSESEDSRDAGEESSVSSVEERARIAEEKAARYKAERDRLKEKKGGSEEVKVASDDDRYSRLELKMDGITDSKAQETVIDYAKFKGISVSEAAQSPVMRAELKQMAKVEATPASSSRTGQSHTPDPITTYKKTGKMPTDSESYDKVYEYLRKRDQNKSRL